VSIAQGTNASVKVGRVVDGEISTHSASLAMTLSRNTGVVLTWDKVPTTQASVVTEVHGYGEDVGLVNALVEVLCQNVISEPA